MVHRFLSNNLVHPWFNPSGKYKTFIIIFLSTLIIGITLLVYVTGGTVLAYPHLMYIPIILAALFFRFPGGILSSVVGGLLLGPLMPLNTITGEMQPLGNWLVRSLFFITIGTLSGGIFSALDKAFKTNEWQLQHDFFTKLPNRSYMTIHLQNLIESAKKKDKFAVIMFVINNAHEISNLFGLDSVDKMLLQIADRISDTPSEIPLCFISSSICGLVVRYESKSQLEETLLKSFKEKIYESYPLDTIFVFLDISIGIALYPENFHNADILIRKAKSAAYTAHTKGLNYWFFKGQEIVNEETLAMIGSINQSLKENQFFLHYQPIIDLHQNKIIGVESLVRWYHPKYGLIPPKNFLRKIESTSLIYQVQEWVFKRAFIEILTLDDIDNELLLTINLSARALANYYNIGSPFFRLIDKYEINPERIVLEVTETTVMTDQQNAFRALQQFRDHGVKIAIDDIGTGYSALNYLKILPADFLKIDKSFMRDLQFSNKDQTIVSAILSISKKLGFKAIAEGVENEKVLNWLKAEDCPYAQGYFIGNPMPIQELLTWMKDFNAVKQ